MQSEPLDIHWHPDIDNWPYMGWNNVWGGGGEHQEADIVVPPARNLYNAGVQDLPFVGNWLAVPTVALVAGLLLGIFVWPKVKPKAMKMKNKLFEAPDEDDGDVEEVPDDE